MKVFYIIAGVILVLTLFLYIYINKPEPEEKSPMRYSFTDDTSNLDLNYFQELRYKKMSDKFNKIVSKDMKVYSKLYYNIENAEIGSKKYKDSLAEAIKTSNKHMELGKKYENIFVNMLNKKQKEIYYKDKEECELRFKEIIFLRNEHYDNIMKKLNFTPEQTNKVHKLMKKEPFYMLDFQSIFTDEQVKKYRELEKTKKAGYCICGAPEEHKKSTKSNIPKN